MLNSWILFWHQQLLPYYQWGVFLSFFLFPLLYFPTIAQKGLDPETNLSSCTHTVVLVDGEGKNDKSWYGYGHESFENWVCPLPNNWCFYKYMHKQTLKWNKPSRLSGWYKVRSPPQVMTIFITRLFIGQCCFKDQFTVDIEVYRAVKKYLPPSWFLCS